MNRRKVLQAFGAGGVASLAGCGEGESSDINGGDGGETAQQTGDGEVTIDGLSEDQIQETYLDESLAEYGVVSWARKEQIRVYDSEANELTFVEPENGWFLEVTVYVYNAGGENLESPEKDSLSLYNNQTEYEQIPELPSEKFSFEDIREQFGVTIDPSYEFIPNQVEPDDFAALVQLFDVESEPVNWAINVTDALSTEPDQDQYVYYSE
ncbi:hypothetical protein [Halobellus rarus]|uniref:Tat (Twin-arginine translocation) pathway signal sequence n=1 Tax=Halobellus rarus TaxID=1126237 RepID=A0ABD6CUC1_9EURY|nr:hypothetical protein [Halobellus rarus]